MKVGNMVKWMHFPEPGIVIDTCMIDGLPHATVFWLIFQKTGHHPYMDLTIISRA